MLRCIFALKPFRNTSSCLTPVNLWDNRSRFQRKSGASPVAATFRGSHWGRSKRAIMKGVEQYERRLSTIVASVRRRSRSVCSVRRHNSETALGFARRDPAERGGVSQAIACQPESARTKAKGQVFRFGPRTPRLEDFGGLGGFW